MSASRLFLITGAAGFVGRRLVDVLRDRGPLRCLVRNTGDLEGAEGLEVVTGDMSDRGCLESLLEGVDCAYYLIHSMEAGGDDDFAARDRALAQNMADAARAAGVRRIVYLGGILPDDSDSAHLDSRREVEDILAGFGGDLVALRAAMIVGRGSASFDTLTQIVERMPVLALPSWRDRLCQPIAIDDVIAALAAGAEVPAGRYDVGGADRISFRDMTEQIAEIMGRAPRSIDLPFTNSKLEATAAALVTDQDRELLGPLMAGMNADLVVEDNALTDVFGIQPAPFAAAATDALSR